jgi:hypothetical protein
VDDLWVIGNDHADHEADLLLIDLQTQSSCENEKLGENRSHNFYIENDGLPKKAG